MDINKHIKAINKGDIIYEGANQVFAFFFLIYGWKMVVIQKILIINTSNQ